MALISVEAMRELSSFLKKVKSRISPTFGEFDVDFLADLARVGGRDEFGFALGLGLVGQGRRLALHRGGAAGQRSARVASRGRRWNLRDTQKQPIRSTC